VISRKKKSIASLRSGQGLCGTVRFKLFKAWGFLQRILKNLTMYWQHSEQKETLQKCYSIGHQSLRQLRREWKTIALPSTWKVEMRRKTLKVNLFSALPSSKTAEMWWKILRADIILTSLFFRINTQLNHFSENLRHRGYQRRVSHKKPKKTR